MNETKNDMNQANQHYWDSAAADWAKLRVQDQIGRKCVQQPALAFDGEALAKDARFWSGISYLPGLDESLLDWRNNPRAGLPVWLTVAAQKPAKLILSFPYTLL